MTLLTIAAHPQNRIGVCKMKRNLIDMIPTPTPEQGDKMVNLALAFVAGFIVALLIYGG
jgi:hypothetical protein